MLTGILFGSRLFHVMDVTNVVSDLCVLSELDQCEFLLPGTMLLMFIFSSSWCIIHPVPSLRQANATFSIFLTDLYLAFPAREMLSTLTWDEHSNVHRGGKTATSTTGRQSMYFGLINTHRWSFRPGVTVHGYTEMIHLSRDSLEQNCFWWKSNWMMALAEPLKLILHPSHLEEFIN